jgi:hypothetical protein
MTDDSTRELSDLGFADSTATRGFFDRSTTSFQRDSRSDDHRWIRVRTKSATLAFLAMRFPPRDGAHNMHFGNMKNADQLVDSLEVTAVSRSLPHVWAKAERWLFGTRFIRGVSRLQMSINGTEKDDFASGLPANLLSTEAGEDGDFSSTLEGT